MKYIYIYIASLNCSYREALICLVDLQLARKNKMEVFEEVGGKQVGVKKSDQVEVCY